MQAPRARIEVSVNHLVKMLLFTEWAASEEMLVRSNSSGILYHLGSVNLLGLILVAA